MAEASMTLCEDGHGPIYHEAEECPACAALQELRDEFEGEEARLNQASYDASRVAERARNEGRAAARQAEDARWAQVDLGRKRRRGW
mgnify:CR=1 FL=1